MANLPYIRSSKLVELLQACDRDKVMYVRVLGAGLALGVDPFQPTHLIDLSKEMTGPYRPTEPETDFEQVGAAVMQSTTPGQAAPKLTRRSGDYWFELNGHRFEQNSLKELLSEGLRALEQKRQGTLEKLSHIKPRSRRIVARDPKQLFEREHLTKEYSEKLIDGWWFGTNNSANETEAWLVRACQCAGLTWGEDFKTSLNHAVLVALEDF